MERVNKSINNSVFLEFHNISYSLISPKNKIINDSEESVKTLEKSSDESKFILNDITGYALPKQVLYYWPYWFWKIFSTVYTSR